MTIRDAAFDDTVTSVLAEADTMPLQMDEDAFRGFYERTARMLWSYLERMTGDRSAADDLLQESYYKLLRADVAFESESHRRHYLFRIATNLARDKFRRRRDRPPHVPHTDDLDVPASDGVAAANARIDVADAMARLAHRDRALLWLAYAEGISHREIAAAVGVRATSVKTLLFRARRRLAAMLDRKGGRA